MSFIFQFSILNLEWNIAMLLGRVGQFLGLQLLQGTDDAEAGVARFDDIVNVTILGGIVRIRKQLGVLVFFFC